MSEMACVLLPSPALCCHGARAEKLVNTTISFVALANVLDAGLGREKWSCTRTPSPAIFFSSNVSFQLYYVRIALGHIQHIIM